MGFTADVDLCCLGVEIEQLPISSPSEYLKDFFKINTSIPIVKVFVKEILRQ